MNEKRIGLLKQIEGLDEARLATMARLSVYESWACRAREEGTRLDESMFTSMGELHTKLNMVHAATTKLRSKLRTLDEDEAREGHFLM